MYETAVSTIVSHVFAKHGKQSRIDSICFNEVVACGPYEILQVYPLLQQIESWKPESHRRSHSEIQWRWDFSALSRKYTHF